MNAKVAELKKKNIFLGTSSWKYPGWRGLVYQRPYKSEKYFNDHCLEEYAEHFTTVGVDHTYYAWPTEKAMARYAEQTPEDFRFGFKITEKITVFKYPKLKRYGKEAGLLNESFLNPELFEENFVAPLTPLGPRVGPLMLEFSQFYPGMLSSGGEFVERLDHFFSKLPSKGRFQFAIEMRNANWLKPPYFAMLERHQVAHVFNSWTRMPPLVEQLALASDKKMPAYVSRILLAPGTKYEEAVEAFSPYDQLQEEHPEIRKGGAQVIKTALQAGVPAYVFVNNRAEGCAPRTIEAILENV